MKPLRKILILVLSLVITTSCDKPNVLTEYSKTDGDDALFYESRKMMDSGNWDGAITILTTTLSPTFRSQTKVKERLMHAYGGKCGINFFNLIQSLKNVSSSKMFEFALELYATQQTDITACDNSIATLRELGATANLRTNNQNVYAALLGLTRMAVALKTKFDTESSGLGDGNVDVTWNSCDASAAASHLTDADVNRISTGIGLIFENLTYLSDELTAGSAGSAFDSAKTLCEATLPVIGSPSSYDANPLWAGKTWDQLPITPVLPVTPKYSDFGLPAYFDEPLSCTNTLDSAVTENMRIIMRRLIASSDMGFGSCNISGITVDFTFDTSGMPPYPRPEGSIVSSCCPNLDPQ
ncbi:hypothetical protein AZI86_02850 [Bdellovibrio bacteriovorus]|uniref:Lipoprotein n=1 Tax=Bdellovibrio bacteriovorus TaxID=959 RepID=A0A150WNF2_BDEBC|nr:hypothetical protein [Bdellovibrio bacteriovorus]KYG66023.1 hypothetical protein AZI86_02850 [Bdellovibrio bacteriovorus]